MTTPDAQAAAIRRALPPGSDDAFRALASLLGDALAWAANRGRLRDAERQLEAIRKALPYGDACHHCRGGAGALPCPHCGTSGSEPDLSIAVEGQLAYLAERAAEWRVQAETHFRDVGTWAARAARAEEALAERVTLSREQLGRAHDQRAAAETRAAAAEEEVARYRVSLVAHHNIAMLSDEAIRESRGGPCQVCERAQREAAGRSVAIYRDRHIRAVERERDALRDALERAAARLHQIGYPESAGRVIDELLAITEARALVGDDTATKETP